MTPAGAALGVFPLAKEFGWTVEYILWELPMAVFNQAHTFALWRKGTRLRPVRRGKVNRADIARKLGI